MLLRSIGAVLVFFTRTLCKSKIHCVVPIAQMASLRDFFKLAPSGSSLPVPREDELLASMHFALCTLRDLDVAEAAPREHVRQCRGGSLAPTKPIKQ